MSVKSALAKLSATAAGGALLAGGAVHVAEKPVTDRPQYKTKMVKQAKPVPRDRILAGSLRDGDGPSLVAQNRQIDDSFKDRVAVLPFNGPLVMDFLCPAGPREDIGFKGRFDSLHGPLHLAWRGSKHAALQRGEIRQGARRALIVP